MTREEAVSIIEDRVRVTEYVKSSYVDCVDVEALKMAIEALKGKDTNVPSRKGVFIPDITVEMFRNASLEGVEDFMTSGEMEDISLPSAQPEQSIAQERYEDLCEYFKDCFDQGRSVLNDRKEFKSWLDRMKWHVMECNKLGRELEKLSSAQPEQRYTEEELRVFAHGISLSLLSKRSAQHWQYDEDTATEIKFLERLYDKVVADMGDEQDE